MLEKSFCKNKFLSFELRYLSYLNYNTSEILQIQFKTAAIR